MAAMRKLPDGTFEGVKGIPFNYTGKTVLGLRSYRNEMDKEMYRVIGLKGQWKNYSNGYKDRYPESWREEVCKAVDKKYCSVSDIMDHVIEQGNNIYQNTDVANTFLVFHDGLTQWWEKESQQYLNDVHNFRNRQLRCYGDTNMKTRYHNKVVGKSPEMCRALDSHGFADFKVSIAYHISLTSVYNNEDPRKFLAGTPKDLWLTMLRCWEMEPTSSRIVTDILNFPEVLRKIIACNGAVIPNEALRTGRRAFSLKNTELKNKPRASQRKSTMKVRPTHTDAL